MSRLPRPARRRWLEAVLWLAVGLGGLFVLVPAGTELLEARRIEAAERSRTATVRRAAEEAERALQWALDDPLTDPRVLETEAEDLRRFRAEKEAAADDR
ncbi:MAG: hypothetical protein D6702_02645 [Planctomycetota bacterium]|nr:MAG: hypothetical protein D6702_02645 [Planctomycetota bacterium]